MFNLEVQLRHLHGGASEPMVRREHHGPADHDLERVLAKGGEIWRCETCQDEVVVIPSSGEATPDSDH
jgi:hypothetical protein